MSAAEDAEANVGDILPNEILISSIFPLLDLNGAARASQACRLWNAIAHDGIVRAQIERNTYGPAIETVLAITDAPICDHQCVICPFCDCIIDGDFGGIDWESYVSDAACISCHECGDYLLCLEPNSLPSLTRKDWIRPTEGYCVERLMPGDGDNVAVRRYEALWAETNERMRADWVKLFPVSGPCPTDHFIDLGAVRYLRVAVMRFTHIGLAPGVSHDGFVEGRVTLCNILTPLSDDDADEARYNEGPDEHDDYLDRCVTWAKLKHAHPNTNAIEACPAEGVRHTRFEQLYYQATCSKCKRTRKNYVSAD
jgi:hypothetical protein